MMRYSEKHRPYYEVKDALKKRRVRYEDLAELLGRSVPAVCKKMNGESDFYLHEALTICKAYGLEMELFAG